MGVKEFCMPIFHFAFALNVLCHIAINWTRWCRDRNALSFRTFQSLKTCDLQINSLNTREKFLSGKEMNSFCLKLRSTAFNQNWSIKCEKLFRY
jgi:hypothetical protein